MIKVGLTGGIGCGKSTVAKIFKALNVPVYEADAMSKNLLNTHHELKIQLKNAFGEDIYENEEINRKKFAQIIFGDKKQLEIANNIIHPFVKTDFDQWAHKQTGANYVIEESAIIFENNIDKNLHLIVLIIAPEKLKIQRVIKRDSTDEKNVRQRMKHQLGDEEKKKRADFCIMNDEKSFLIDQVIEIDRTIKNTYCNG